MSKEDIKKAKAIIELADAAEMLWVVLANVSEGDWTKQTKEWQVAAKKWRDNYFKTIKKIGFNPLKEVVKER